VFPVLRANTSTHAAALLLADACILAACFVSSTYLDLTVDPTVYLLYDGGAPRIALVMAAMLAALSFLDLYGKAEVHHVVPALQQFSVVAGTAMLVEGLAVYVHADSRLPARVLLPGTCAGAALVLASRLAYSRLLLHRVGGERLIFVGVSPVVREVVEQLARQPELNVEVAGFIADEPPQPPLPAGKLLGPMGRLSEIVHAVKPQRLIVGMPERRDHLPVMEMLTLRLSGLPIEEAATVYERVCQRVCLRELRPAQLIYSGELGPQAHRSPAELLTDYLIASAGVVLLAPFLALAALAIRLDSRGPVVVREPRTGRRGQVFQLLKFRSVGTRTGRLLRKYRLDELPKLFNVLRGDMSVVGPRPERPELVPSLSQQIPFYRHRLCVKPGVTGWAQIHDSFADTVEDAARQLEYDLYYIKNKSWSLDLSVVLRTAKNLILGQA